MFEEYKTKLFGGIYRKLRSIKKAFEAFKTLTRIEGVKYGVVQGTGKLYGKPAEMGKFSVIDNTGDVYIGKDVKIGFGAVILSTSTITGDSEEERVSGSVHIEDGVEIGSNAVVLPGVRIGEGSTIGAGAVVREDIPPYSVAVGMPAKVVKEKK